MEGLAAASAVIAVVSLAGQVLHGCTYLRDILQNAIEAPRETRLLLDEISIIEEIVKKSPITEYHQQALDLCNSRLSRVCDVMSKFVVDIEKTGRCRKWSKQLSMAMSTEMMQRHLGSLREARGYLESVQNQSITTETLKNTHEILNFVEKVSTSQSEATRILNRTDHKLDDLHKTTKETQRLLHCLAERFVLQEKKSRILAKQNERLLRNFVEKTKLDSFVNILLPGIASIAQEKQRLGWGGSQTPSQFYSDWSDLPSDPANIQNWTEDQTMWEMEPRIFELPDQFSLQTASWNQKDYPPYTEKGTEFLNTTPQELRFLRFTPSCPQRTKCSA